MNSINVLFNNPYVLLLIIPGVILSLIPYFRLNKQHRKTRNRIVSMVLHITILTLVILVLSGFTLQKNKQMVRNDVFIVVDKSDSMKSSKSLVDEKVEAVIKNLTDSYRVGLIGFSGDAEVLSPLSKDFTKVLKDYKEKDISAIKSASNVEAALRLASEELKLPGRIILITDGLETDGKALNEARKIAYEGSKIDVIYINKKVSFNEVQLNGIHLPSQINRGQEVNINFNLYSESQKEVRIKLYDNGELITPPGGNLVMLNGGVENVSMKHTFNKGGVHELKALITSSDDEVLENNTVYSFINIDASHKRVLIIEGMEGESSKLLNILTGLYDIDVISPNELNANHQIIKAYDGIILMNIKNQDLPNGFDSVMKEYVEVFGGSMFTVGGDKAYQKEDMQNTIYESMLPVFANTEAKSMAVVLVIDKSGSMVTHESEKLELAKQGAINSVNALKDNDFVSIVLFDRNPVVLVEPMPASRREEIIASIKTIEAGQGTHYTGGLQLAKNQLDNFPGNENFNKHIIFLTDGAPQDSGYEAVINQFGNISLSTIAIGDDHGIDYSIVESMVRVVDGRGKYYQVVDEYELPAIMEEEARSVSSDYINEEEFEPVVHTRIASVASIMDLPLLKGYYGTRLKSGSTLVLRKESDPIYAEWTYGLGKVGSFTSDLSGVYSNAYFEDTRGVSLIKGLIEGLLPKEAVNTYDTYVKYTQENHLTTAHITAFLENGEALEAVVIDPKGNQINLPLNKQTDSTFTTSLETKEPGLYKVSIVKKKGSEIISMHQSFTAFSYSKEYDMNYDDYEVFNQLNLMSKEANGEILFNLEHIFIESAQVKKTIINPALILLLVALLLFLIDIIVRKFKFKWPHEWLKKDH